MKKHWQYYLSAFLICSIASTFWYYSSSPSRIIASNTNLTTSSNEIQCGYRDVFYSTNKKLIDDYISGKITLYSGIPIGENINGCAEKVFINENGTTGVSSSIVYLTYAKEINNTKYCIYKDLAMLDFKIEVLAMSKRKAEINNTGLNASLICESLSK